MAYPCKKVNTGAPPAETWLNRYAEETITDEQAARVLAPVLAEIRAGRYDRAARRPRGWLAPQLGLVGAVLALVLKTALF